MKLGEISDVRSGLVLSRKKAGGKSEYVYYALNLRSIDASGYIDTGQLDLFNSKEELNEEYLTRKGDVIVRMSTPYTAVIIDESTENLVISSNFVLIRQNGRKLLPEYLYWLLNTAKVKHRIYESATSNMLGSVNAKYISDFEVEPISLAQQRQIAELNTLAKREIKLLQMLTAKKEQYYAQIIDDLQKKMRKENKK